MTTTFAAADVPAYLVGRGIFDSSEGLGVEELGGGVSATVFAVRGDSCSVVLKQALPRFRVADEWLVPRERALFEAQALELMAGLAPGLTPRLLDVDEDTFTLVIEAAPASWCPWKLLLLGGRADTAVARRLGELLTLLHRETVTTTLGSAESFEAQRIDPYFRTIERRHPYLAGAIGAYVERLLRSERCVVHGDYSPKNVLVGDAGLWVIDWEIVHRGDPAFDVAFLLTHLLLKAIHRPGARAGYEACADAFLAAYEPGVDVPHTLGLVGCLMLARVDGKSPAEYLDDEGRARTRAAGISLLTHPPATVAQAFTVIARDPLP